MKQNHKDKISDDIILNYYKNNKTLHESASELSMTVVSLWRRAKKLNIKWSDKKRPAHNRITLQ